MGLILKHHDFLLYCIKIEVAVASRLQLPGLIVWKNKKQNFFALLCVSEGHQTNTPALQNFLDTRKKFDTSQRHILYRKKGKDSASELNLGQRLLYNKAFCQNYNKMVEIFKNVKGEDFP